MSNPVIVLRAGRVLANATSGEELAMIVRHGNAPPTLIDTWARQIAAFLNLPDDVREAMEAAPQEARAAMLAGYLKAGPNVLGAVAWMAAMAADRFSENAPIPQNADPAVPEIARMMHDAKGELRDLLAVRDWLASCGCEAASDITDALPSEAICEALMAWGTAPPEVRALKALRRAESFMAGFEDDVTQEDLPATLADIRAAIAELER